MVIHIKKHIKSPRMQGLSEAMRHDLKEARVKRGWSQLELGQRIGLPQMHISNIETGKIIPRFDTLIELVRILDYDFLMVPRSLVPTVLSIVHDHEHGSSDHPLYADDNDTNDEELPHHEIE